MPKNLSLLLLLLLLLMSIWVLLLVVLLLLLMSIWMPKKVLLYSSILSLHHLEGIEETGVIRNYGVSCVRTRQKVSLSVI